MKKITLLLLLPFVGVLATWSQSTFTILPKFQIGDTLVYEAASMNNQTMESIVPDINPDSRKFYLIVKGTDNEGNLKVDYWLKEIKIGDMDEAAKEFPNVGEVAKFFSEDIQKMPFQLTIDRAGRFLGVDNKDKLTDAYIKRLMPVILDMGKKSKKHKPTAEEIEEAKEILKAEIDIMDIFEEIPAMFKYYGQPLMEGKSETVDSVTTKYVVARMGDGTTWLKTNIDLMNGDEEVAEVNPGEEFLEENTGDGEEVIDEGFDLGITATRLEDYKYSKEGIVTYMKFSLTLGNKDISETNTTFQSGMEVKLLEIKRRQ